MIFDYPNNKFIEDGRTDRLLIEGFAFIVSNPVHIAAFRADDDAPMEDAASVMGGIEFIFKDKILKVYSGGTRITTIGKLLFIMAESEVSAAQEQMYRRTLLNNTEAIGKSNVLAPEVKLSLQSAIERLAIANGIVLPENVNFFNDKFILYMYPLLRTMANSSTNFYKILEDLRFVEDTPDRNSYTIPHLAMEQTNISDALKAHIGTSSRQITKFVAQNIVRKTDLVKSLSPQLLNILINHSGKIFQGATGVAPDVKILTCYEDILIEIFVYVKYAMDIFDNNVDHVQRYLNSRPEYDSFRTNKKVATFLRENLTPKKIFSILDEKDAYFSSLSDVATQFEEYKDPDKIPRKLRSQYPNGIEIPKNWKTVKELHDKVSVDYNKIKAEDNNKVIEYSPTEFQLHGMVQKNIELVLPSEGATLVEWGRDQRHCVASYADRAASKSCMIMGVKVDGVHKYTLELRTHEHIRPIKPTEQIANGFEAMEQLTEIQRESTFSCEVIQFRGESNSNPLPEHREIVNGMLKEVFTAGITGRDGMTFDGQLGELQRALEAGNYNAAPGQLAQGGALQVEPLAWIADAND